MLQPQTNEFLKSQTGKMVLGLILGDGTIAKSRFEHTQRSLYWEYSRHISMQFQREFPNLLTPKILNQFFYTKSSQNPESLTTYKSQTFYTKSDSIFKELYNVFYPNGKKVIPMTIVEEYFTEESLLYLYFDDGQVGRYAHSGLGLCLCNFDEQELIQFRDFLTHKFQLEIQIHHQKQYLILDVQMNSSKQLLSRFNKINQKVQIADSVGLIWPTKIELKRVDSLPKKYFGNRQSEVFLKNPLESMNVGQAYTNQSNQNKIIGILQGFVVGGANFIQNKEDQTGYIRLHLQKDAPGIKCILSLLKQRKPKIKDLDKHKFHIGISIDQPLMIHLQDIVDYKSQIKDLNQSSCVQNDWFWTALFAYKGRDLSHQRGGFTIGLNHLTVEQVQYLSNILNKVYFLETSLRYRDKKMKASIYIPVKNCDKFYRLFSID